MSRRQKDLQYITIDEDVAEEEQVEPDVEQDDGVTKKKWEFTPARKAALEKAHKKRSEKAEEKKKLKAETEKKALEIIEDRRLQTSAEDDKLDHVLYELDKLKTHITQPEPLRPPPLRRSRTIKKREPLTETETELDTETDVTQTETETETEPEPLPPPRRKKNILRRDPVPPVQAPVERSADYLQPKINVLFS